MIYANVCNHSTDGSIVVMECSPEIYIITTPMTVGVIEYNFYVGERVRLIREKDDVPYGFYKWNSSYVLAVKDYFIPQPKCWAMGILRSSLTLWSNLPTRESLLFEE